MIERALFRYVSSVCFVRVISMYFMELSFLVVFARGLCPTLVTVNFQIHIIHHVSVSFPEVF